MKTIKQGFWALVTTLICLSPSLGHASIEQRIQIDFSYDTQAVSGKQIVGYRLYKEGVMVCETNPATPQSLDCPISSPAGTYNFTLSACFNDGTESPQSAPFTFSLIDESAIIGGLQVLAQQHPTSGIDGLGSFVGGATIDLADVIHTMRMAASMPH